MALRLSLSMSALSRSSLSKFITGTEDPAPPGDSDLTDVFGLLLQNGTELILTEDSEFILRQLVDKNIIITQDNKELILQNGFNLLLEQQDYMLAEQDDSDTRTHITTQAGGNLRLG